MRAGGRAMLPTYIHGRMHLRQRDIGAASRVVNLYFFHTYIHLFYTLYSIYSIYSVPYFYNNHTRVESTIKSSIVL